MRTYSYTICNGAVVKHIFTGNNPSLQTEASDLLVQIQLQVLLRYQTDGAWAATGSYFAHIAGQGQDAVPWSDAPQCLSQAREFLSSRGLYGELETFDVNKLVTLAWSGSAGGKKGSVIYAKASPVALLCLGTDTTFSLVPRSGFGGDTVVSGRSSENKKSSQGVGSSGHGPKAKASTASGGKTSEAIRVNLVHGDVLLLQGDDFEYSLTRTGTAMVLIGSAAT
ncbi:hypothetical protein PLICRDRAFT_452246 [Plicaturopsis crispa FD-325 SS-3]|uniref:Uncharacterized protein n=1 Tax=Plicaturopsis crispa FD-325 SS-3 TaxID=944288 RepID=A0A0C9SQ65_PLICR|nr:hypothetical protein PLICRDRAFT_452246 [Plicaturopsis crispa FD-325 SS-3]